MDAKLLKKIGIIFLVLQIFLGSIFAGIIVHESVHVMQFEGKVQSIGIVWGDATPKLTINSYVSPAFFVNPQQEDITFESSDIGRFEEQAYLWQYITTFVFGVIGFSVLFRFAGKKVKTNE